MELEIYFRTFKSGILDHRPIESVNSIPVNPATGSEFTTADLARIGGYKYAGIRCSAETYRLVESFSPQLRAEMWNEIAAQLPDCTIVIGGQPGPWVTLRRQNDYRFTSGGVVGAGGTFLRLIPMSPPWEGCPFYMPYSRNGFSDSSRGLELLYRILLVLRDTVNKYVVRTVKAREAIAMAKALSETATFRAFEQPVFETRRARLEFESSEARNDRITTGLAQFQRSYLLPQLNEVGAQIAPGVDINSSARPMLAAARGPLSRYFRGGRSCRR